MKNAFLPAIVLVLFNSLAFADSTNYIVTAKPDASAGVSFSIGYTAGTHFGSAGDVQGSLQLQKAPFMISNASISIPLASLNTENSKRDCHVRESIGLDYKVSIYPGSHVCDGSDTLPKNGNNAIAFPTLQFSLVSLLDPTSNSPLVPGVAKQVNVTGTLEMHGVKNTIQVPLTITLIAGTKNSLSIKGDFELLLSDYGIIVKKFLFVTVFDNAHVTLDILLTEQAN